MRCDNLPPRVAYPQHNAHWLVQQLVEWRHFRRECQACQHELAPIRSLCVSCEMRLATHCPGCGMPLPPVGAYGCPCCGLAAPPVGV